MIDRKIFTDLMCDLTAAAIAFVEQQEPLARGDFAAPEFDALKREVDAIKAHWQADVHARKADA